MRFLTCRTKKLMNTFNKQKNFKKEYGHRTGNALHFRLTALKNARTLSMVPTTPPERRHQLSGDRKGQYAIDIVHPHRLIFRPNHDPIPRKEDGEIDTAAVTTITIMEVVDYH